MPTISIDKLYEKYVTFKSLHFCDNAFKIKISVSDEVYVYLIFCFCFSLTEVIFVKGSFRQTVYN